MSAPEIPGSFGEFATASRVAFDTLGRYGGLVGTVKNVGITVTPDDWVPWFIYDYGLEETIPYVRDFRRVLAEGPAWQARRGTDDGIAIGIGWVDSVGAVEPPDGRHDWWEFQVRFPEPVTDPAQLRQLDGIIRLSKASEDILFRMFSPDYDHRPVRMDQHRADAGGWMDGYSGRQRWDGGPLISFGRSETGLIDVAPIGTGGTVIETSSLVSWFDGLRYDTGRDGCRLNTVLSQGGGVDGGGEIALFDGGWPDFWPDRWPSGGSVGPLAFVGLAAVDDDTILFATDQDSWPTTWPAGTWADATGMMPIPTPSEPS